MLPFFLPAFFKRGAGLGPAIAFLFSGPAINVLAIVYSAKLLGWDLGIARIIAAIIFSVVIGLIMAFIYRKEKSKADVDVFSNLEKDPDAKGIWQQLAFIGTLIGILIFAASKNWVSKWAYFLVILALILWRWFKRGEIIQWFKGNPAFYQADYSLAFSWCFLSPVI